MPRLVILLAVCLAGRLPAAVYNLRVVTDASPDCTDLDSFLASVTSRWPTPAEKLWALWYQVHLARRQTNPMHLHGLALTDPIRQFNDYGYTMCSTVAGLNCALWDRLGFPVKYWDISLHTVPEVFYDGRWHMYDNSMSAIYTLCDGRTIAGVEDIGREGGCAASQGRVEPGHVARYHCLTATSPDGFLTGADDGRSLASEYRCFDPRGLKYRPYYNDWDRGHRYILNLRDGESYVRHYRAQGPRWDARRDPTPPGAEAWFVPNGSTDRGPQDPDTRYGLRGNGLRTWTPDLSRLAESAEACRGVRGGPTGIVPEIAGQPGEVVFKIEGANVLTSLRVRATAERAGADDRLAIDLSTTAGLTWQPLAGLDQVGEALLDHQVIHPVNGCYEVLVRFTLQAARRAADVRLSQVSFEAVTMLNAQTQPRLNLGRNEVYLGAGDQTESIVVWPELQADRYRPWAVEAHNVATAAKHPGYQGALFAAQANKDAWVTFRVDAPGDVTDLVYGGRFYNRAPGSHIDLLHSFDGGATWTRSWSLTSTAMPWDVLHDEVVTAVPPGTRSVLLRYLLRGSAAGPGACSLYAVRLEVHHRPAATRFEPFDCTFEWDEVQDDYSTVHRSHTEHVVALPHRYRIHVGGADHPQVTALRLGPPLPDRRPGYSDGVDVGGEKYVGRWETVGRNLAVGRPYTVSEPGVEQYGAGDPDLKKLTDGVVGSSFAGGANPRWGALWTAKQRPQITVDLGTPQAVAAFRIHLTAGWPWWDALRGQVKDQVEVLTSLDGQSFTSQGLVPTNLRRRDVPYNHLLNDDQEARGWNFALVPPQPVTCRWVRYALTPARLVVVTEVQALDSLRSEPFDLRLALPDEYPPPRPR